jgi:cytidylate kinase
MAIVTISRGSASGGLFLAKGLAKKLGYDVITREEIIRGGAAKFGVVEAKLEKALLGPPVFSKDFKQAVKCYLTFYQEALCDRAQNDNLVYLGHAGHLLLRGISSVLRIRLIAPSSYRIRTLVERDGMTDEQAAAHIEQVDAQRRAWTLLLYGVDWLSPNLYDLTINLETMNIDSAVEIASAAVNCPEFAATSQSRKAVKDLLLESRVKAALTVDPATASAEIEVRADSTSGTVCLIGKVHPSSLIDEAFRIAGDVDGVTRIDKSQLDGSDTPPT